MKFRRKNVLTSDYFSTALLLLHAG